jgi:hypothetical protein
VLIISTTLNGLGASHGTHTGFITAIEHNDNLIWDADIVYFKTDTESTQEDEYCVDMQTSLRSELEKLSKTKTLVTIEYKHPFWFWKSQCNGGESIIIGYEIVYQNIPPTEPTNLTVGYMYNGDILRSVPYTPVNQV